MLSVALTVLQTVNLVLREKSILGTDLSALTSNAQQEDVDAAIAAINETYDELASLCELPAELAEGTITLVTNDRDYTTPSDFKAFANDGAPDGPRLICETDGSYLSWYPGGYKRMRLDQLQPDNETGAPQFWVLDDTSAQIYLDKIPTAAVNGKVYRYLYEKHEAFSTSSAASTFAYLTDPAIRMAVPAMAEVVDRKRRSRFDEKVWQSSIAKAAKVLSRLPKRTSYGPKDRC